MNMICATVPKDEYLSVLLVGAPFWTIKIYLKSSRCIMVKTTERHGEAPLKDDLLLGYTGGLFSLHVG